MALTRAFQRSRAGLLGALTLLAGSLAGCAQQAESRTELVVVVDSDLSVPAELDRIRIRATSPSGETQESSALLGDGDARLPRSLALHHAGGALGPFSVEVVGQRGGSQVLERVAEVTFVRGKSLVLPLHLVSACRRTQCDDGESCGEKGCASITVDTERLATWDGEEPPLDSEPDRDASTQDAMSADAGRDGAASDARMEASSDAPMCVPEPERCNQLDDDCDGRIDDGFNLMTDPENCGRCGMRCNTARREVCCAGSCARGCQ